MTVDFQRFIENLGKEYKTMLLALAFIFPLAYADCWKLSSSFASLDLVPQVILALAVSVILMFGGIVLDLVYIACLDTSIISKKLSFPILIMAPVILTALVIIDVIHSVSLFSFIFIGFYIVCLFGFFYQKWKPKRS